jgi:small-conductance mechanosensitive channel
MNRNIAAVILAMFAVLCFGQLAHAKLINKTSQPTSGASTEQAVASTPSLADLVLKAAELSKRLTDTQESLEEVFDPSETEASFRGSEERLSDLSKRLEDLKTAEAQGYSQLIQIKTALQQETYLLEKNLNPVTASLRHISDLSRMWSEEKKQWSHWQASPDEDLQIPAVQSTFSRARETISKARTAISQHLEPLLSAATRGGDLKARTYSLVVEVNDLISDRRDVVSTELSPPMFSSRYFAQFSLELGHELRQGISAVILPDRQFFARQGWIVFLQVFLALALAVVFLRSRQSLEESEELRSLAQRPFALAVTVSVGTLSWFYTLYAPTWYLLLGIFFWIALARVLGVYTTKSTHKRLIYGLAFVMISIQLIRVVSLPLPLFRLYVFIVALFGFIFCLRFARQSQRRKDSPWVTYGLGIAGLILMVVVLVEVSGQADLALKILESSFTTLALALIAWLLMILARGGVDWAVHRSRLQEISIFRNHGSSIAAQFTLFIKVFIGSLLIVGILTSWKVYDSSGEAFRGILSLGVALGSQQITLGLVLGAAALLYGSFVASSAIQTLLMEEVFPKRQVEPGVGLSISKLIQYSLILVGFLLALAAVGVTLTNITILGGAIGVGIGFGLQAIVNNFASGIILLFERPIRVGDMIQLVDLPCTVKKIGLRSTVVASRDDADIVIPNSDLITNQVTNWTLSERRMRLRIPVGVAYGSDVPLVMRILKEVAEGNLSVLSNPASSVLFLGFGESSLNFELRVWIRDFLDRFRIQSELIQAIDSRFRSEGVEIPFPQRDLHVRSVDESASSTSINPKGQPISVASREEDDGEGDGEGE